MSPAGDTSETPDGFRFRGGHPALDLTATLLGRRKGTRRELLSEPSDLARWLRASGLARETPQCDSGTLATARQLREAIYLLAQARLGGLKPPAGARRLTNAVAVAPSVQLQLDAAGASRRSGDAASFLAHLARAAIELVGGDLGERLRQCDGPGCAILFLDMSRTGERRWCSMAACGNRHKAALFRRRRREGG